MYAEPLRRAAAYCQQLTERSRSNFYFAFLFLPPAQREALFAVYAFCRLVDDAADDAKDPADARARLAFWQGELDAIYGAGMPQHEVSLKLRHAVRRFPI